MLVEANGIHQHVQRLPPVPTPPGRGGRPVVVFLHGLGTDSLASYYFTVAGPLADAGFDVVMYDLRGHGRTDRPATGYEVSDFLADLDGLLASLAVEGQVHLVGNSFGGTIAFSYALHRPDEVASVVLIESEPATETWAAKMAELLGVAHGRLCDEDALAWVSERHGPQTSRLARAAGQTLRATTMAAQIPTGPLLSPAQVAAVRLPVLAVYGSESDLVGVGAQLRDQLEDCTVTLVPEQEHSVLVAAPAKMHALLVSWLTTGSLRTAGARR
jgi:3-oxoadipate enol-lactonase